jgi:hypothetical protein
MSAFIPTTEQPVGMQFYVGHYSDQQDITLKTDLMEEFVVPRDVVKRAEAWVGYQSGDAATRARLLVVALFQFASERV